MRTAKRLLAGLVCTSLVFSLSGCWIKLKFPKPYYLEPVDTGIHATDDVYEGYMFKSLTIEGEVYQLLTDEHSNLLHADKDKTEILSPFANFGSDPLYTLYEVKTDAGIKLYTDNRNLALFCKETDADTFYAFYDDWENYDFYCYNEKDLDQTIPLAMDAGEVERLKQFVDQYSLEYGDDGKSAQVEYQPSGAFEQQRCVDLSREKTQAYRICMRSKDLVCAEKVVLFDLILCHGDFYYAIDGEKAYAVPFEPSDNRFLQTAIR